MIEDSLWSSKNLENLVDGIVQCSGMTVSIYDKDYRPILRKFATGKLVSYLRDKHGEKLLSDVLEFEDKLTRQENTKQEGSEASFYERLDCVASPIWLHEQLEGFFVIGYVFTHFPSPEDCDTLARKVGDTYLAIWHNARADQPSTAEKLRKFAVLTKEILESHISGISAGLQLAAAGKMKDEILSLVSHELRTPLTSTLLRLQILERALQSDKFPAYAEKVTQAIGSLKAQDNLINDLLDSTKISQGKLNYEYSKVDINSILRGVFDQMKPLFDQKGVSLVLELAKGPISIKGDEARLKQVLVNLLNNALKFTPEGRVLLRVSETKAFVRIEVIDSGIGLSKEELKRIFYKFVQGVHDNLNYKGLGLGLFICDQIVRAHGGEINAESEGLGKGTTFTLKIPR